MKVLVAGASGVIGRPLLPLLESAGHEVVGLARTVRPGPTRMLAVDALDRDAVAAAVREVAPDAVVNVLTAIPARLNPRRMSTEFALTNRLRTEGTRNLVDAARAVGVRRLIAEGLAYAYDPAGAGLADEDEPLWRRPPAGFASALAALEELEATTTAVGGTVLRMGHLYGPGTMFAADGSFVADIRAGKVPIVGNGGSVFSFVHVDDRGLGGGGRARPGRARRAEHRRRRARAAAGVAARGGRDARRAAATPDAEGAGPARGGRLGRRLPRRAARR